MKIRIPRKRIVIDRRNRLSIKRLAIEHDERLTIDETEHEERSIIEDEFDAFFEQKTKDIVHYFIFQDIMRVLFENTGSCPNYNRANYRDDIFRVPLNDLYEELCEEQYKILVVNNRYRQVVFEHQNCDHHICDHEREDHCLFNIDLDIENILRNFVFHNFVESLNKHEIRIKTISSKTEDECIICLQQINIGSMRAILKCGHNLFHIECLVKHMRTTENHRCCPICRAQI